MTGSLQIKNNKYYMVLNTYAGGKRKLIWINTGLPVKGNKTRAEKMLRETLIHYEEEAEKKAEIPAGAEILFSDAIRAWYRDKSSDISHPLDEVTKQGYDLLMKRHILPYFDSSRLKLSEINKVNLQEYFTLKANSGRLDGKGGLSPRSLKLLKNIVNQTLLWYVSENVIPNNPCQFVKLPSCKKYEARFFTKSQIDKFLDAVKNEPLYPLLYVTSVYGLRRSEALGLCWDCVDFENNTVLIMRTVSKVTTIVEKDKTKNQTSRRTYPMPAEVKTLLQNVKAEQDKNREYFGDTYHESNRVFTWEDGKPFDPDYVSRKFSKLLKEHNMPHIRFHELRHSSASNLLSMGFELQDVKDWLGHSTIKTTSDIYGHLDAGRKKKMAEALAGKAINT